MSPVLKYYLIAAAVLLAGCAGKEIVRETLEAEIPIDSACVSQNDIPDTVRMAEEYLTPESEDGEVIKQVWIELVRQRAQNEGLRALLVKCAE